MTDLDKSINKLLKFSWWNFGVLFGSLLSWIKPAPAIAVFAMASMSIAGFAIAHWAKREALR